jgi:hypothetical protein
MIPGLEKGMDCGKHRVQMPIRRCRKYRGLAPDGIPERSEQQQ